MSPDGSVFIFRLVERMRSIEVPAALGTCEGRERGRAGGGEGGEGGREGGRECERETGRDEQK